MTIILLLSSLIATILLVWFKSNAFVEYGKLLGLGRWLKLKEYEEKRLSESFELSYPLFLRMTYDNFIFKLITCPLCISLWLSSVLCLFVNIYLIPIVYILSLFIYGVIIRLLNI
jgi:hypothetical protein